jgi:hypothetical protein
MFGYIEPKFVDLMSDSNYIYTQFIIYTKYYVCSYNEMYHMFGIVMMASYYSSDKNSWFKGKS